MAIFALSVVTNFSIFQKMTFVKFWGIFVTIITPPPYGILSIFSNMQILVCFLFNFIANLCKNMNKQQNVYAQKCNKTWNID